MIAPELPLSMMLFIPCIATSVEGKDYVIIKFRKKVRDKKQPLERGLLFSGFLFGFWFRGVCVPPYPRYGTTACEKPLSLVVFVFEHLIYSVLTCILTPINNSVNTFLLKFCV